MKFKKLIIIFIVILSCFLSKQLVFAAATFEGAPTASEVLVVYNSSYTTDSNSNEIQDSLEIAEYYKTARSIPAANVLGIAAPTTEEITRTQYNDQIKAGIESYLTSSGLKTSISYIVLIKGIPLKIQATNGTAYGDTDYSSVDAAVCLLYETYDTDWRIANPYYNVDSGQTKAFRFKTESFATAGGVYLRYLTTRLDGYSVADVEGMIDRAVAADAGGSGYWIVDGHQKSYDHMATAYTNLKNLNQNINPDPWSDTTSFIINNASGSVMGYTSHGIHAGMGDGYVSNDPENVNHLDFTLLNGAVFSTYESFNGYGFTAATQSTHGQVAEWIQIGGSGGIGNVYEPWASSIADEDIFMPAYAAGYSWADAAYQSLAYMDFVTVVVGDPLMTIREIIAPAEVSSFNAVAGDTQISLSWTNPGDADFAGVKILRKTGSYPTYSGDGTVVYDGTDTSYVDTGLVNGTEYFYVAFAYDEVPNYSAGSDSGAKDSATPAVEADVTPPGNVSGAAATGGLNQIYLSWNNPSDADFAGVKILRKTDDYPANSTDGTVAYSGNVSYFFDSNLTPGTTYYYTIFAYDEVPNYSAAVAGAKASTASEASSPVASEPDVALPGKPTSFNATAGDTQVSLSWTNPTDSDFKGVKILRRTDYYPISATNGVLIYQGSGTSYTNTGLNNGTTYFYTIFAYDKSRNYSIVDNSVKDKATPYSGSPTNDATEENSPSSSFTEPDVTTVANVTDMTAVVTSGQIALSWTNPFDDGDWMGTRLVRKAGSYPASPTDGTMIYDGRENSYNDINVVVGTTYYYYGFAYDKSRNFSDGEAESAKTSAVAQ